MCKSFKLYISLKVAHFEFDANNTFQKSWDRGMCNNVSHPLVFYEHSVSVCALRPAEHTSDLQAHHEK